MKFHQLAVATLLGGVLLFSGLFQQGVQASEPTAEYFAMAQPSVERVVVRQRVVARQRRTPLLNLLSAVRDRVAALGSRQVVRQRVVTRNVTAVNKVRQLNVVHNQAAFVAVDPVQYLLEVPQLVVVEPQVQRVQQVVVQKQVQKVCVPQVQQRVIVKQRQAVIGGCH